MYLNRRPNHSSTRGMAALALALLLGAVADPPTLRAQVPPFPTPLPACVVPDSPDNDAWPKAVNDSIGTTAGAPITFSGASLLANDVGSGLAILLGAEFTWLYAHSHGSKTGESAATTDAVPVPSRSGGDSPKPTPVSAPPVVDARSARGVRVRAARGAGDFAIAAMVLAGFGVVRSLFRSKAVREE